MDNDKKVNWLGLAQAIGVAVVDYHATANADGSIGWDNPWFYVGGAIAILVAVKAWFTNKPDAPKV